MIAQEQRSQSDRSLDEVSVDASGRDLARAVLEALRGSRHPIGDHVGVEVRNHVVHLSGIVGWEHQRVAAQWEAERVPGAHVVHNDIKVRARCSETAILADVREALDGFACGCIHEVRVEVDGADVSMTGSVCSYSEWLEAGRIVKSSPAVLSVRNDLVIAPLQV